MAMGSLARGYNNGASVWDFCDGSFHRSEFEGVRHVVGKINRQKARLDFAEVGLWIVIPRRFITIEIIIGVELAGVVNYFVKQRDGFRSAWRSLINPNAAFSYHVLARNREAPMRGLFDVITAIVVRVIADRLGDHAPP